LGAVGLGLLAAFFLYTYVNGLEDDIKSEIEPVQVVIAAEPIPAGTLGEEAINQSLVEVGSIPRENVPETPVTNTESLNNKVALFDIPQNLPITNDMFVSPSDAQVSFRRRLENPEWVTVTVDVDQTRGAAGLLVPGDEVNIMVPIQIENIEEAVEALPEPPDPEDPAWLIADRYEMLYQQVHILAIGTLTEQLPGEDVSEDPDAAADSEAQQQSGLITFNVPADAGQLIATAALSADIYLQLVPIDYVPAPVPPPPLTMQVLPGQDPELLTPYGPDANGRDDE
jgi:Flp pilus assembly protein CpaB